MLPSCKILAGHVLDRLRELAAESAQCCVTSPPYWGLRDYGTDPMIFGGAVDCAHDWQHARYYIEKTAAVSGADSFSEGGEENKARLKAGRWREDDTCRRCGAWRGQLGLEATPGQYVDHLVEIFAEVRRVLKKDGTCWLNLGDSYCPVNRGENARPRRETLTSSMQKHNPHADLPTRKDQIGQIARAGLKEKDLVGIPWMTAFALRAAGWWLRSEVIWNKPNPMPESVTDRPTKSHEQIFLLTKSERYFYDARAVQEPSRSGPSDIKKMIEKKDRIGGKNKVLDDSFNAASSTTAVGTKRAVGNPDGRNRRSVWNISTKPFSDAHFATFPVEIPKLCIMAGTKTGDTVIDPFGGSGTTGKVALELGRSAILIELNPAYVKLIEQRTATTPGFF